MFIDWSELSQALAAFSSLAAALVAAYNAYLARKSASAAEQTVHEARKARQHELAPQLVVEKNFLDFTVLWKQSLDEAKPSYSARNNNLQLVGHPSFSLSNFGPAPALELTVAYELDDGDDDFLMPGDLVEQGITVGTIPKDANKNPWVFYESHPGVAAGTLQPSPLLCRVFETIPSCAPSQTRIITFPEPLLDRIFIRGLQRRDRSLDFGGISGRDTFTIRLRYYTVEGEARETVFLFRARGYANPGLKFPSVHCRFNQLPKFAKSTEVIAGWKLPGKQPTPPGRP